MPSGISLSPGVKEEVGGVLAIVDIEVNLGRVRPALGTYCVLRELAALEHNGQFVYTSGAAIVAWQMCRLVVTCSTEVQRNLESWGRNTTTDLFGFALRTLSGSCTRPRCFYIAALLSGLEPGLTGMTTRRSAGSESARWQSRGFPDAWENASS